MSTHDILHRLSEPLAVVSAASSVASNIIAICSFQELLPYL